MNLLDKKDISIITISALTTQGDTKELYTDLNTALENGLSINEINEVLTQIYAYAGFPRSLGGIFTFMKLIEDRKAKGIKDEMGSEVSKFDKEYLEDRNLYGAKVRAKLAGSDTIPPDSGYQLFAPTIDQFLKEHLFADIFARDILTHKQRELSTITVLSALGNVQGPLAFHLQASLNTGWSKDELKEFVEIVGKVISKENLLQLKEVYSDLH